MRFVKCTEVLSGLQFVNAAHFHFTFEKDFVFCIFYFTANKFGMDYKVTAPFHTYALLPCHTWCTGVDVDHDKAGHLGNIFSVFLLPF